MIYLCCVSGCLFQVARRANNMGAFLRLIIIRIIIPFIMIMAAFGCFYFRGVVVMYV